VKVRYELAVGLREEALNAWKSFVKYKRVRRNRRINIYSLFMLQLEKKAQKMRIKKA
jgi:hypothetical protein